MGEHHNSKKDHGFQASFIESVYRERVKRNIQAQMAIGLEQVQVQFQPVLDEYVAGNISVEEMRERVEWNKRWMWPFDVYEPVFQVAKGLGIRLIALNVNSEDLSKVEKMGYPGLSQSRLRQYITDP